MQLRRLCLLLIVNCDCVGETCGYLSDGHLVRESCRAVTSGYTSDNNYDRRADRLAYEQQRARAEAEHRQYLQISGKIRQDGGKPTYKVTGARKNVKKSDSGKIFLKYSYKLKTYVI